MRGFGSGTPPLTCRRHGIGNHHREAAALYREEGSEFYRIASLGYLLILPACLFIGINTFGSGLFTAFGNGLVSALLSLSRTFVVLSCCLFGLTALFGGPGLWCAWPAGGADQLFYHGLRPEKVPQQMPIRRINTSTGGK